MVISGIFREVNFIADGVGQESVKLLVEHGGVQYQSLATAPGQTQVHLFTNDFNSPISIAAQHPPYSSRVVICTPEWIKVSASRGKLQDARRYSPDPRQFFTGVCVTCSELPSGDKEAIYGGVLALGGQYSDALVKGTTHVVALTLDSDKVREVLSRPRAGVQVVLPHWFDDCLRLRRRIPSEPYCFPHPKILQTNQTTGPPPALSQDSDFRYLCDSRISDLEPPETDEDIFGGKKIFLSIDLDLGPRLLKTVCAVLGVANGILARNLASADVYIGKYRDGAQYLTAARSNKIVGNYTWILYCVARGKYSSPRDHLLHYPLARGGHVDFKNDVITVSNYTGEARIYLERLIMALGAKFTRNMKPENTHLITAAASGEKYNTAKQWGISCVNHLWLEESYARWQKQALTTSHYVTFPKETNLMDVIAQTQVLSEGIELFYLEDDTEDEEESHVRAQISKDGDQVTTLQQNPVPEEESQDVELPEIKDIRDFSSPLISAPVGAKLPPEKESSLSSPPQGILSKHDDTTPRASRTHMAVKRDFVNAKTSPIATPMKISEVTPSSRGSTARKASQAAASRLKDNMEDANKFGQQMRNKHKLPPLPSEMQSAVKKPKSGKEDESAGRPVRLVLTGCPELTETLHTQCTALGIEIIDDPTSATHLVAPRIARTKKFVVAIPSGCLFVNWQWLLSSIKMQSIQNEKDFPPESAPAAAWSRSLVFEQVLERAKVLKLQGGLLRDFVILVSDAVTKVGGFETYRDIVEANGGTCGLVGRRGVDTSAGRIVLIADGKADPAINKYMKSVGKAGSTGKENKDSKQNVSTEIYDREWLMICAIRQELIFDKKLKLT